MFKYILYSLVGMALSVNAMAAGTPIEDRDAFERQYFDCLRSNGKNDCFSSTILEHTEPRYTNDDIKKALQVWNESSAKMFSACSVYAVHVIERIEKAGVFDSRSFLLECSGKGNTDGAFISGYVIFRKVKGKWYVNAFSLENSTNLLINLLNIPALSVEYTR
ncbi:MAG: hypothetical protein LBU45_00700 [Azoarcus sp.]|nr:hypothetical protein [Azoarcus sp.]